MNKTASLLLAATFLFESHSPSLLSAVECGQTVPSFSFEQIPDHVTTYQDDPAPEWKKIWDQARRLYTLKKYGQAQVQYELLLANKDNVDQARWEYVTILICRKQWQRAETELAVLISHDPDRPEYQLAKAEVALGSGDLSSAVKVYAQLYEQQCAVSGCTDKDKVRILSGYIAALEGLGRVANLSPLMEQLVRLRPENYALRKRIADITMKIGQPERALVILSDLEKSNPEDFEVLQGLALVQMSLGNSREAAAYWQQVVGLNGESREAHEQLIEYYHGVGNWAMELKHVETLLSMVPDDCKLLEQAARLNLALDRPDLALEYYNWLLSLQPGNREIEQQKDRALHELAAKLLALIENAGSNMLWQDLVQVTDDRVGLYRTLADMLREQGRRDALIQVLLIIHKEVPGDDVIGDQLTALLKEQGRGNILVSSGVGDSRSPDILPQ